MKLSYGLTVCNESQEISRLLTILNTNIDADDEIVVVYDKNRIDQPTLDVLTSFSRKNYIYKPFNFKENFLENKNYMNSLCTGEYIFQLDADEIPETYLVQNIKEIIELNKVDVFVVARKNEVIGLTVENAPKLGFTLYNNKYVNWPDYQKRIYKNTPSIKWEGHPVHGMVTGYKTFSVLPAELDIAIIHTKKLDKQLDQLKRYDTIQRTL